MIFPNPTDERLIGTADMGAFTGSETGSLGEKLQNLLDTLNALSIPRLIVQESDQTVNSGSTGTTLVDTELEFAVAANEVWQFEGVINLTTPAVADFKIAATGPTGAVGSIGAQYWDISSGMDADGDALGTELVFISGGPGATLFFRGGIHNGANAGSLTIQFAQKTSDAGNTTVLAGSYIKYQRES